MHTGPSGFSDVPTSWYLMLKPRQLHSLLATPVGLTGGMVSAAGAERSESISSATYLGSGANGATLQNAFQNIVRFNRREELYASEDAFLVERVRHIGRRPIFVMLECRPPPPPKERRSASYVFPHDLAAHTEKLRQSERKKLNDRLALGTSATRLLVE